VDQEELVLCSVLREASLERALQTTNKVGSPLRRGGRHPMDKPVVVLTTALPEAVPPRLSAEHAD
jgi:hypothetical protein